MSTSPEYAVLGSAGQLGREFITRLPADKTVALTRADADLSVPGQVGKLIQRIKPRTLVNCSAYNLVDKAEDEPEVAFKTNTYGVRELAIACRDAGATLVHFSTDYVFGIQNNRSSPYTESDLPGPISAYGISKLAGEYFVRAFCPQHYLIRTCGLYGRHGAGGKGGNFVETMLKLAHANKTIHVVNDQTLTPTLASDVAMATLLLLKSCPPGLYHLTNAGQCSWYEFARSIFEIAGVSADLQPTTSAEYGSKAQRPSYSVLATQHVQAPRLRHWREALADYLSERKSFASEKNP